MTALMFAGTPVPLDREKHKNLRFTTVRDYGFSAGFNSVPLAGIEFFEASRTMPVLFSKAKDGNFYPLVLLSLRNAGHEFVDEQGRWKEGGYVPSIIRRYPFALTREGNICYDGGSTAFSEEEGEPLFDDEGKNTQTLDNIIQYLNQYDAEMRRTQAFCEALTEHELLVPFNVDVGPPDGNRVRLQGMSAIDEKKFSELDAALLEEWFRKGWIGWMFAHLHSLGALGSLPRDTPEQQQQAVASKTDAAANEESAASAK